MNKWDKPDYQRIARADFRASRVEVQFEDKSVATLTFDQLAPKNATDLRWLKASYTPYELIVPTSSDDLEIPWTTIRTLSDRDFSNHLAKSADQEARHIGVRLKELRESRDLSSKDLAERAGIAPQSLSRIENGRHDVTFTTLQRILTAMGCSLNDLTTPRPLLKTMKDLIRNLKPLGLTRSFVEARLIPARNPRLHLNDESLVKSTATVLSSIYGWSVNSILEGRPLALDTSLAGHVLFKNLTSGKASRTTAYTLYVHWLAIHAVESTPQLKQRAVPKDPNHMRDEIVARYGDLSFASLLSYTWDSGFVVIPLEDEGVFHGACWKIKQRIVLVVKQKSHFQARWLFDLAHELAHAILHISDKRATILEPEEISQIPDTDEEEEASDFAQALIFKDSVEDLAQECVKRARNDLRMLKSVVPQVSRQHQVPADALANYLAYRLSLQNQNWWGTANNLQVDSPSPLEVARKEFHQRVQLQILNAEERTILEKAV
jgi:transcriptional regulator with XRE-family HTH domain/Zn-dependent peptidase ImmA (M78 family)